MPRDSAYFHLSTWTIARFFAIIIGLVVVYLIRDILFSLIFAVIVASALEPAIDWLKRFRVPRILGVIGIYVAIAAIFAFSSYLIFPLLFDELRTVSSTYSLLPDRLLSEIKRQDLSTLVPFLGENVQVFLRVPSEYLEKLSGGFVDVASTVFGGIFSFVLIIVFSFYLATQEKGIEGFLKMVTPLAYEPYIIDLWSRSQRKLGRWLRAQMLLGAVVGVLLFFGLTILGVPHAFFFAALAGVFEIIPIVGPILAAVPAVTSAFLLAPLLGLFTLALYVVVQQTESHVIVPVVMKKTVGLSPLVVVFALLVGGKLGGIFGILLAIPLTAILAELLNDWDRKKRALIPE